MLSLRHTEMRIAQRECTSSFLSKRGPFPNKNTHSILSPHDYRIYRIHVRFPSFPALPLVRITEQPLSAKVKRKLPAFSQLSPGQPPHLPGCARPTAPRVRTAAARAKSRPRGPRGIRAHAWALSAPGQGSARKMAATVTFLRLLGRGGGAALSLPGGARCFGVRTSPTGEKVTHTGQAYGAEDYRRIRFVGRQKEVNENFAIDLIAEQPVSEVESRVISCDGGGGALGHPRVYINLDKETKTGTCGYCGLQFRQHHH
uniref:NADH dehydrogenase [ubiquinone] iron-sulfur protein 6, mitochondrial n=4 Tax=Equus TaxID=9789 RepID=F6XVS1_HORSE